MTGETVTKRVGRGSLGDLRFPDGPSDGFQNVFKHEKDEFCYWLSKGQDCKYIGLPPRSLSRISSELGRNIDELGRFNFKKEMKKLKRNPSGYTVAYTHAMESLLAYCENQTEIKQIMRTSHISRENLRALYDQLIAMGGGQWACGHPAPCSVIDPLFESLSQKRLALVNLKLNRPSPLKD